MLPGFWGPGCHLNILIDLAITALASKGTVKAICMFSEGYRTHRGVTGPMNFKKKSGHFFSEIRAPRILGTLPTIQALYLTLQSLLWLVEFAESPYA